VDNLRRAFCVKECPQKINETMPSPYTLNCTPTKDIPDCTGIVLHSKDCVKNDSCPGIVRNNATWIYNTIPSKYQKK